MELNLTLGMKAEVDVVVTEEMCASHMGSGSAQVLSTPYMILLMEQASFQAVQNALPENCTTVGTRVCIDHMAATPIGGAVKVVGTLQEIDRKRLVFQVEAFYGDKPIGKGTHDRFVIDTTKFAK